MLSSVKAIRVRFQSRLYFVVFRPHINTTAIFSLLLNKINHKICPIVKTKVRISEG